jgi:hypothetical protein
MVCGTYRPLQLDYRIRRKKHVKKTQANPDFATKVAGLYASSSEFELY